MRVVTAVLTTFVATVGAVGVVAPARLLALVRSFGTPVGLWTAAVIRLVLGTALFVVAPESRAPDALRVIGILIFVSGVVTPFVGVARLRRILGWWSARPATFQRAWAASALALGVFLLYAIAR
ncbi:MAG: hypothetical protein HYU41_20655 [Candidatus Rokubacteria bacterium]|nr:hypothetical protein [Candidatus Rokubacteria bacterium]